MPMAATPPAGTQWEQPRGRSSDGRHTTRAGIRSELTAGPCSNSLVSIHGFPVPSEPPHAPPIPGLAQCLASLTALILIAIMVKASLEILCSDQHDLSRAALTGAVPQE